MFNMQEFEEKITHAVIESSLDALQKLESQEERVEAMAILNEKLFPILKDRNLLPTIVENYFNGNPEDIEINNDDVLEYSTELDRVLLFDLIKTCEALQETCGQNLYVYATNVMKFGRFFTMQEVQTIATDEGYWFCFEDDIFDRGWLKDFTAYLKKVSNDFFNFAKACSEDGTVVIISFTEADCFIINKP